MQTLFASPDLIIRCLLGFAVGGLIGLERQKRMTEGEVIGLRSFGLHSLLGTLSAYSFVVTGNPIIMIYGVATSLVMVTTQVVYKIFRTMRKGLTTTLVFALAFVLGTLVGIDTVPGTDDILIGPLQVLAMTVSFLIFLVLEFKEEVAAAIAVISRNEMISAAELGVLILFLWPLILSLEPFVILGIQFPIFQTYLLIVILLSISFTNYILAKKYKSRGPYYFGFFGGLANSEATVTSLAEFHVATNRMNTGRIAVASIFANIAMTLRNGLIIILLDTTFVIIRYYLILLLIVLTIGLVRVIQARRYSHSHQEGEVDLNLVLPFEFSAAVKFAVLFTIVSFFSLAIQKMFGSAGVLFIAIIGGFVSAGAVVASVVPMFVSSSPLPLQIVVAAVTLATISSFLNKMFYVYMTDRNSKLVKRVLIDSAVMAVGVLIFILLLLSGVIFVI